MKAVIYARYSSDSQREESIDGQIRECKEYAERSGIMIVGTYIDRALSAKTDNRPDFQRMIKDSAKHLFDIVIVWKLDRFSRNRYDSAMNKSILRKNGVKVISAKENISDGPEGIILESMLEGYAEYYSAELSEKIHRGQQENALKGLSNGGKVAFGFVLGDDRKLQIDPLTAPIVLETFTRYAEGETVREIVDSFNERGLKTGKGKPFSMNSFNRILKNRKYIGEYRYRDVVITDAIPAIVPDELFERVQMRMEKNKKAPASSKADVDYLLTTKLICGDCEKFMVGESGKSHTGKMHYYYKCGTAKRSKGCKRKALRKAWIERIVVLWTVDRVLRDEEIEKMVDQLVALQDKEDTLLPSLHAQLAEVDKGIENLVDAIQQGMLTKSTKNRLDDLEAQKEDLEISVVKAELQNPKYSREQVSLFIKQFKHGDADDVDYQRKIIDIFVNSIYVFDDYLVFTYNYKDGTERVSIKDIEAAFGSDLKAFAPPEQCT